MDINEFLRNGGYVVPNPNYNPKSKKNKEPRYVVSNIPSSGITGSQYQLTLESQKSSLLGKESEFERALDYHLSPSMNNIGLDYDLARAQAWYTKAFNGIVMQGLIGELALGIPKGGADLAVALTRDVPIKVIDYTLDKIFGTGPVLQKTVGYNSFNYSNPVSSGLGSLQDYIREDVAPINTTPGVDIWHGGFTDAGWIFSNAPSVMSSLAMLYPTKAATSGITKLGSVINKGGWFTNLTRKAAKASKLVKEANSPEELNRIQLFVNNPLVQAKAAEGVTLANESFMMRTIENYQEAQGNYTDIYSKSLDMFNEMSDKEYYDTVNKHKDKLDEAGIDITNKDEVAKWIARQAADRTFQLDFTNIVFDAFQLHTLRNIGKLRSKVTSYGVKQEEREAIRQASLIKGKKSTKADTNTPKEAESNAKLSNKTNVSSPIEESSNKGFKTKVKEHYAPAIKDFATGTYKAAFAEMSEGAEEAVNYIAQQEGITYGDYLLGVNKDKRIGDFWSNIASLYDTRLADYIASPELHESVFWGWMGGVIFHTLGSAANKRAIYKQNKENEKKRGVNPETGESINTADAYGNDWISMSEQPEIKAAREAIRLRTARLSSLQDDLNMLADGKNPLVFDPTINDFAPIPNDDDKKKQEIIQQLKNKYITQIAKDALHSGTYESLRDYFKTDAVKNAMVELGLASKEEIDSYTQETLESLEHVRDLYNQHQSHVMNQFAVINSDNTSNNKKAIPLEYAQIIANSNMDRALSIEQLNKQINSLLSNEAQLLNISKGDSLQEQVQNTKRATKANAYMHFFAQLTADRAAIEADDSIDTWTKTEKLRDIDAQRELAKEEILKLYDDDASKYAALLKTIRQADSYKRVDFTETDDKGRSTQKHKYEAKSIDEYDYSKTDEEIISLSQYKDFFKGIEKPDVSNDSFITLANKIQSDLDTVTGKGGLYDTNNALFNLYNNVNYLELQAAAERKMMAMSVSEIRSKVDALHNRFNQARIAKIKEARDTITEMYDKYYDTDSLSYVEKAITSAYRGDEDALREALDELPDEDAAKLSDAITIFNFSNDSNDDLYQLFKGYVAKYKEDRTKPSETSAIFQKPSQSSENKDSNNQSQTLSKTPTNKINNVGGNIEQENTNENDTRPNKNVLLILDSNGNIKGIRVGKEGHRKPKGSIPARLNPDGTIELSINTLSPDKNHHLINNDEIFEVEDKDKILQPGTRYTIIENPIIYKQGTKWNITKGTAKVESESSPVEEVGSSTSANDTENFNSETNRETNRETNNGGVNNSNTNNGEEANNGKPLDSSTGEGSEISPSDNTNNTPVSQPDITDETVEQANQAVLAALGQEADVKSKDFDIEKAKVAVKAKLMASDKFKIFTEEYIDKMLEDNAKILQEAHDFYSKQSDSLDASIVGLATGIMFSKREERDTTAARFTQAFIDSFAAVVDEYARIALVPEVNGKKVINLSDILKLVKETFKSSNDYVIQGIYDSLKDYILSEEGQEKYHIEDVEDVINDKVLDKVDETTEDAIIKRDKMGVEMSIDIPSQMNATKADKEKLDAAVRDVRGGDRVTTKVSSDNRNLLIYHNGNLIGFRPIPYVVVLPTTRSYHTYNSGWRTDVRLGANGVESDFKDILMKWFTGSTKEDFDMRSIIEEYKDALKNNDKSRIKKAIDAFKQHVDIENLIHEAKKEDYKTGNRKIFLDKNNAPYYDKMINHLADLYDVAVQAVRNPKNKQNDIAKSLDSWFDKMYRAMVTTNNVVNAGGNVTATVGSINEKPILNASKNAKDLDYDKMPLAKDAIGKNCVAKVGFADNNELLAVSGEKTLTKDDRKIAKGNTVLVIYSRNSNPDYVHAWGRKITDFFDPKLKDTIAAKLGSAAINKTRSVFDNFISSLGTSSNPNKDFDEIRELINNLIANNITDSTKDRIPLFRAKSFNFNIQPSTVNGKPNGIVINWFDISNNVSTSFYICYSDKKGDNKLYYGIKKQNEDKVKYIFPKANEDFSRKITNSLFEFITENCIFNIDSLGISTDNDSVNNTSVPNLKGWIKRKLVDGRNKLSIKIEAKDSDTIRYSQGNFEQEFDSYNDFLINGEIIKANLKKDNNGYNFSSTSNNKQAGQRLFIDFSSYTAPIPGQVNPTEEEIEKHEVNNNSPVEELTTHRVDTEVYNNLIRQFNENTNITGNELLKTILSEKTYDYVSRVAKELGLDDIFPPIITFDYNMNKKSVIDNLRYTGSVAYADSDGSSYYRYYDTKRNEWRTRRIKKGTIVVGRVFAEIASSENRQFTIRTLVHERIHQKLREDGYNQEKLLNALADINSEFKTFFDNDLAYVNEILSNKDKHTEKEIKDASNLLDTLEYIESLFKNYKGNRLYEEFLTESLCNAALHDYLNSKKVKDVGSPTGKKTLFDKIAEFFAKLFNMTVNDDSLLKKELNKLNEVINNENNNNNNNEINKKQGEHQRKINETFNEAVVTEEDIQNAVSEQDSSSKENNDKGLNNYLNNNEEYEDEYDEYDDEDGLEQRVAESDKLNSHKIELSVYDAANRLPLEQRQAFINSVEQGFMNYKCR